MELFPLDDLDFDLLLLLLLVLFLLLELFFDFLLDLVLDFLLLEVCWQRKTKSGKSSVPRSQRAGSFLERYLARWRLLLLLHLFAFLLLFCSSLRFILFVLLHGR